VGIETLLLGGLAAASVASTLFQSSPKVPKAEVPAVAADAARDAGATVRVGVNDVDEEAGATGTSSGFVEQRKQAQTITGLGRGGLAI
jgi:hypothetical protein